MNEQKGSSYVLLPELDVHAAVVVPRDDQLQWHIN